MLGSSMARLELALSSCSVKGSRQSDKEEKYWLPLNCIMVIESFEASEKHNNLFWSLLFDYLTISPQGWDLPLPSFKC